MKKLLPKNWGWPNVLTVLIGGGLSAWLTLDEKSAAAIFGFIGPIIGAAVVIALFVLLMVAAGAFLVSLSR
ncbi:MAG: hypothetical protein AB7D06_17245 [Pedobacter sp.]